MKFIAENKEVPQFAVTHCDVCMAHRYVARGAL